MEGHYTGILASYGVSWTLDKATRDTWQNFYDPNLTIDGVNCSVTKKGLPLNRRYNVRIEAEPEYDYRKLVHLGGTDKAGSTETAGGFGEGTKILALVLLRDYGFTQVRFGSGDWELDFYLDDLPEGFYDTKEQGLFVKLRKVEKREGNFVEFVTKSKQSAQQFLKARNYFYHSENPDFQDPTMEIVNKDGARFGFKLLGSSFGFQKKDMYTMPVRDDTLRVKIPGEVLKDLISGL